MQADEDVLAPESVSDTSLFFDNCEYDLFYNEGGDSNKMVSVTVGINLGGGGVRLCVFYECFLLLYMSIYLFM